MDWKFIKALLCLNEKEPDKFENYIDMNKFPPDLLINTMMFRMLLSDEGITSQESIIITKKKGAEL
jgi:hypothetical protein